MNLGTILSMESVSDSGALGATEDALKAEETALDVAEGNAEVVKEAADIDYTGVAIEDAFEAESEIENLLEGAEETLAEGGMSAKEAKNLEVSFESILRTIGMSPKQVDFIQTPVLTQESYGSNVSRYGATVSTIENLKETSSTIIKKIIAVLKSAIGTVVGFLTKLVNNRALMKKHITNLQAKAKDIDTSKQKKAEDSFKGGASSLAMDGRASVETASRILTDAGDFVLGASAIASAVGAAKGPEDAIKAVKASLRSGMHATNGRTLKIEEKDDSISVTFEEGKKADSIEAPSKEQIIKLLNEASATLDVLRDVEKTRTKFKDGIQAIISRLEEVSQVVRSKIGSEESKKKAAEAADTKKKARIARSLLSKAGGSLPAAAFSAVKAVADYCAQGIRNYKAGDSKNDKK